MTDTFISTEQTWKQRADLSIAHGSLTNSKRPSCFTEGYPTHIAKAHSAYVYTGDGTHYVDFICALGACLFGHANTMINDAICKQTINGLIFSLGSELEVVAAERAKELWPFLERVRFLKNGGDACKAAIRMARAFHGINSETEKMFKMRFIEAASEFSCKQNWNVREEGLVQDVCEGISITTICNGDKEESSEGIFKDKKRNRDRKKTLSKEICENQIARKGECLSDGKGESKKEAMPGMRVTTEGTSTPRRLFEAVVRDMVMSAASLGITQKILVLSDGYHGDSSEFVGLTPPACGIVSDDFILSLFGNEDLIPFAAAVIIEPVIVDASTERISWLNNLREECTKHNTVLIFDEIITGFRFDKLSVSGCYNIKPDIVCFGKSIAGGLPLSIVGGKEMIMNHKDEAGETFISTTFAGDTLALAGFLAAANLVTSGKYEMEDLIKRSKWFCDEFNDVFHDMIEIKGYGTRGVFAGDDVQKALFMQQACKSNLMFGPSFFTNFGHIPIFDTCLFTIKQIALNMKLGRVKLEGKPPTKPFAQIVRENANA